MIRPASALCAVLLLPSPALADYREVCHAAPSACAYAPPDAPELDVDVCLEGSAVTLKGAAPCPASSLPFHASHGEVLDPGEGSVLPLMPLASACPSHCVQGGSGGGTSSPICCEGETCWPSNDCEGVLLWCFDGVCNEDGTVTCFESMEV